MKKAFKKFRDYYAENWKFSAIIVVVVSVLAFLLLFKLGSLVGGLSEAEFRNQQLVAHNGLGLGTIIRDPLFLPYTFLLYLLQFSPFNGPTAIRGIGVIFGALSVFGMFYIFKKWYTLRIAVLGSTLYATTSWFLFTARSATPESTYLLLPLLVGAMVALQLKARSRLAMAASIVFGMSALYIPGVIWFLLPAVIIKRSVILAALRAQPWWFKLSTGFMGLLMLAPMAIMLIKPLKGSSAVENIYALLGVPAEGFHSVTTMLVTLRDSLAQIFVYSNAGAISTPGHLPWFDVCTVALILIGIVQFIKYRSLDRSKLIAIVGGLSLLLISLGGQVSSIILLPFLFLLAVDGLKWLLDAWLKIFPRNPFARSFAIVLVSVLVVSIAVYQTNKYYLAWSRAPETRAVYNHIP